MICFLQTVLYLGLKQIFLQRTKPAPVARAPPRAPLQSQWSIGTLAQAGELIDPKAREPLYQTAQKLINDGLPCLPVAWAKGTVVSRKRVQNYTGPLFADGQYREVKLAT